MTKKFSRKVAPTPSKRRPEHKSMRSARVPVVTDKLSPAQSEREDAAVAAYRANRLARPPAPNLKFEVRKDGVIAIDNAHSDRNKGGQLLANAIGGGDHDFVVGLIGQIVNVTGKGANYDAGAANFMLSAIKGVQPQDEVEAMLAAQMAATHMLSMTFARRLNHVDNIPQQDSAAAAYNKLTRTFATQVEALKRYRTGGEQRVTVQHVNVSDGGQAIVGDVLATPRRREGEG